MEKRASLIHHILQYVVIKQLKDRNAPQTMELDVRAIKKLQR